MSLSARPLECWHKTAETREPLKRIAARYSVESYRTRNPAHSDNHKYIANNQSIILVLGQYCEHPRQCCAGSSRTDSAGGEGHPRLSAGTSDEISAAPAPLERDQLARKSRRRISLPNFTMINGRHAAFHVNSLHEYRSSCPTHGSSLVADGRSQRAAAQAAKHLKKFI